MSNIYGILKQDRLYLLLLLFVAIVTAALLIAPSGNAKHSYARDRSGVTDIERPEGAKDSLNDREAVEKILSENKHLALIVTLVTLFVAAVFFLGLAIDLIVISGLYAPRGHFPGISSLNNIGWGMREVYKVVILYLFFSYIILISESLLVPVAPLLKNGNFRMIFNASVMDILIVIFILDLTVIQYKEKLESLGLSIKDFFRNVYYGIMAYIALVPVLIGLVALIALAISLTKYIPEKQPVVDLFLKEKNTAFLFFTSIFAAVVGPVIEEIFFRGFFYSAAKKRLGIFWATMITASVFAMLHAHLVGFLPILALGIMLAYLYEKTGSLVSSMTVHMTHNLCMVFLVFLVKQIGVYR